MTLDRSSDLAVILADPERVAGLRGDEIPALLGALEQVRAELWAQMVRAPAAVARAPDGAAGDQLLTVAEVAAEARFTLGYVYEAVRRGHLSAIRKGKYVRIRRADLQAWLDDGLPPRGLDPRPGHRDSRSLHGPRTQGSPANSSSTSRGPRASRERGARAVAGDRRAPAQER